MSAAQKILAAAEAELLAGDPGSLRVDRVAQAAAVNKRMIYHYFGDRGGLLEAVYSRQLRRLLAPEAAITEGAKKVIAALLQQHEPQMVEHREQSPGEDLSPAALQCAAKVLLPRLLHGQGADAAAMVPASVTASAWVSFCVDIMSLACVHQAPFDFPAEPGTQAFKIVSERLLTSPKTRLRITPDSRRHR